MQHIHSIPRRFRWPVPVLAVLLLWGGHQSAGAQAAVAAPALPVNPAGYVWDNVRIGGGGFVSGLVTSRTAKGPIYARTDVGGAYRWEPGSRTWTPLMDWLGEETQGWLGIESIALDPANPDRLYLLAGISYMSGGRTAILRSDNRGDSFEVIEVTSQFKAHGNGMGRQTGEKLAVDPHNGNVLYCGTRWNGLFRSTDRGSTWQRVDSLGVSTTPNENGLSFVVFDPASPVKNGRTQTIFAGVSRQQDNLYVSRDGGDSWSLLPYDPEMAGLPEGEMPARGVVTPDGWLLLTLGNGAGPHANGSLADEPVDQGAVWKYHIKDGTWVDISPSYRAYGGISYDPENPRRLVCSTINTWEPQSGASGDRIYVSDDAGESWTDVFKAWNERDYNGITWAKGHSIHWAGSIEFDPADTRRVFVVSGNGIWMTDDIDSPRPTWVFQVRGLEETVPLDMVSIPGGPAMSVIGDYDGFIHHDPARYGPIYNPQIGTSTGLAFAALKPQVVVRLGGDDKGRNFPLFYSEDSGKTWTRFKTKPAAKTAYKGRVAISADAKAVLWVPEKSNEIYRSNDWGQTWTVSKGLKAAGLLPVADMVNPAVFYAYQGNNGTFWVSRDAGASFAQVSKPGRGGSAIIRTVAGLEGHVWIARRQGGLSWTADGGKTFAALPGVADCSAVGLGKAAPGADYPAVYVWATIDKVRGLFRSTDRGQTWLRVNDDRHQYGGPANGQFVLGDWNVFGRVYLSTAGRGIVYGEPAPAR